MKILIVNTQLITGGIATSLVNLCKQLQEKQDLEIDILLFNRKKEDLRYNLPKTVNLVESNSRLLKIYSMAFKEVLDERSIKDILLAVLIKIMRKIIGSEKTVVLIMKKTPIKKGYDVAISFRNDEYQHRPYAIRGCNDFVLHCTDAKTKIAWIHNDPDRHGFTYEVAKQKFRDFDKIVNVSQGCKQRFEEIIPEYINKSYLVYNTFNHEEIINKSSEPNPYKKNNKIKLVTVARLANEQKRIDRIIKVCKKLRQDNITNYEWYIVGDGPDGNQLRQQVIEEQLEDYIIFVGKQKNPFVYMKYADCLVMTSEYEAFGMTLVEALITQTPIITTNHIAAREIIKDQKIGLLAENSAKGIEERVKQILTDSKVLCILKENVMKNGVDKEIALKQFTELIKVEGE